MTTPRDPTSAGADIPAPRSVWVTNDLPPRPGGIEQYVANMLATLPAASVSVLASPWDDDVAHDTRQPYKTTRVHRRPLLPSSALVSTINEEIAAHEAEVVVFGSAWPLAEMAAKLDVPSLAITHGREAGMVRFGMTPFITRLARRCAAMTVLSEFTAERLTPVLSPHTAVHPLPGGVDVDTFTPEGPDMRDQLHLASDRPVVVCISRLVPRKGQDVLVRIWPQVKAAVPGAHLVIVGTGPLQKSLAQQVVARTLDSDVTLVGEVGWDELPAWYRTGDVFAMPCRTRLAGTDVEGLGLVFLEAQACGVPVLVGDSGGAPETVLDGQTGVVVDGDDDGSVLRGLIHLLSEADRSAMGVAAREHTVSRWDWNVIGRQLRVAMADAVRQGVPSRG